MFQRGEKGGGRMRLSAIMGLLTLAACAAQPERPSMWATLDGSPPLIIAHRGASGYLPEHTLEAYTLAIDQGADVVEPDLVFTKDGVLVARHDRYLSTTTDVADHPEFASRKRVNNDPHDAENRERVDWWIEDFTLVEVKTLRARQPFPGRSKEFDGRYEIPTFDEMLALVTRKAKEAGRTVGVYPETKHPGFFASIGHDFEAPLLKALAEFGAGPVFIQSFEPEILKRLKGKTNAKLVQLVYEKEPGAGPNIPLKEIATYADGVGAAKSLFLNFWDEQWWPLFSGDAHNLNLFVHYWTFRDDVANVGLRRLAELHQIGGPRWEVCKERVPEPRRCLAEFIPATVEEASTPEFEYSFYLGLSDGVFTDFPDTAVAVRAKLEEQPPQ
jgi:glycerophosphoryl diester phosphodiesterase